MYPRGSVNFYLIIVAVKYKEFPLKFERDFVLDIYGKSTWQFLGW